MWASYTARNFFYGAAAIFLLIMVLLSPMMPAELWLGIPALLTLWHFAMIVLGILLYAGLKCEQRAKAKESKNGQ